MRNLFAGLMFCLIWICSSVTDARSICENLFVDVELEKSIRGLAKLRMQLDIAKAHNRDSLYFAALEGRYDEKEQSILGHVLENNLMSQEEFFRMISLEIVDLQKIGDRAKIDSEKSKHDIQSTVLDGSIITFNTVPAISQPFEISATPITTLVWWNISALINSKLSPELRGEPLNSARHKRNLNAMAFSKYDEMLKWIEGLNSLSQNREPKLKDIILGHRDGDRYTLPSREQWSVLVRDFVHQPVDQETYFGFTLLAGKAVTEQPPISIRGKEYYGLVGMFYFTRDAHNDQFISIGLEGSFIGEEVFLKDAARVHDRSSDSTHIGLRLVREMRSP